MKRQILICASLLFVLVASISAKEFDPQKLLSSEKLIEAQTIVDRFEAGEKRIKVIVNLAEPVPLRAMTNWKSEKSVRAFRAEIANRQRPVMSSLRSDEFALRHRFENQAGYSGEVTFQGLTKLLDNPMVASVEPVRTVSLHLAQGIPLIKALVPSRTNMYNGTGISIAIVDTGVDYTHPRLGAKGVAF